jgi:hypothetical protein
MKDFIKTICTYLDDRVLPAYIEGGCVTGAKTPGILVKMALRSPVKAAVKGLHRLLSHCRFYYAPDPDEG